MNKYKTATDEDIILWAREGNPEATDYLIRKYTSMVKGEARKLYLIGSDEEDLIQEGMIGLFQAIRRYETDREASFATFARMCIQRQIYSAVTASNRKKHQPLNTYVSFDEPAFTESRGFLMDSEQTVVDVISAAEEHTNPEKIMLDREYVDMIESVIVERLSSLEKRVLDLYLEGRSYDDIASKLKKPRKSIDNAIQRIRKKFLSLS